MIKLAILIFILNRSDTQAFEETKVTAFFHGRLEIIKRLGARGKGITIIQILFMKGGFCDGYQTD